MTDMEPVHHVLCLFPSQLLTVTITLLCNKSNSLSDKIYAGVSVLSMDTRLVKQKPGNFLGNLTYLIQSYL